MCYYVQEHLCIFKGFNILDYIFLKNCQVHLLGSNELTSVQIIQKPILTLTTKTVDWNNS